LPHHLAVVGLLVVRNPYRQSNTIKEQSMSKSKNKKQFIVFDLTVLDSEVPFATLQTSVKKFAAMRACFENLGLSVGVVGFFKSK
jgi:hypothetical protein